MLRINSGITTSSDIIHKVSKAVVTRIVMTNIVFSPNNVSSNASTNLFRHNTSIEIATKINPVTILNIHSFFTSKNLALPLLKYFTI